MPVIVRRWWMTRWKKENEETAKKQRQHNTKRDV